MTSNIDHFNRLVGLIVADLYEQFPVRTTIQATDLEARFTDDLVLRSLRGTDWENTLGPKGPVFKDTGVPFISLFGSTVYWLIEAGFLHSYREVDAYQSAYTVQLTSKALATLYQLPESIDQKEGSWGDRILSGAKAVGVKSGNVALGVLVQKMISQSF